MSTCANFVFELKAGGKSTELVVAFGHGINEWSSGPNFFRKRNGVPTWFGSDLGLTGTGGMQGLLRLPEGGIDQVPLKGTGELDLTSAPATDVDADKGTWTLMSKH